jgi:hypothetical protein
MSGLVVNAGLTMYFLPALLAALRKKRNTAAIFTLNLLSGLTLVGWVIAMVWATMAESSAQLEQKQESNRESG